MLSQTLSITLIIIIHNLWIISSRSTDLDALSYYEVVEPQHLHPNGRHRRDVSTLVGDKHLEETIFVITGHMREFVLQIYKNDLLISRRYSLITQDPTGAYVHRKSNEHCYYHGYLKNRASSSVAISTCNGLKGLIIDSDGEEFTIEPHPAEEMTRTPVKHILYSNRDVLVQGEETKQCKAENKHPSFLTQDHRNYTSFLNDPSLRHQQQTMELLSKRDHERYC